MFEIGSKNTFDIGGRPMVLNASAYYFEYTDQVFSTLVGIELLDNDPINDAGCLDSNPNTPCSQRHAEPEHRRIDTTWACSSMPRVSFGNGFNIARHAAVAGHGVRGRLDRQRQPPRQPGRRQPAGGSRRQRAAAHAAVDAEPAPRPGLRARHRHARLGRVGDLQELVLPDGVQRRLRARTARARSRRSMRTASPTASARSCCGCTTRSTATSISISASATRTATATSASRRSPTT